MRLLAMLATSVAGCIGATVIIADEGTRARDVSNVANPKSLSNWNSQALVEALSTQGVARDAIRSHPHQRVPVVCGVELNNSTSLPTRKPPPSSTQLTELLPGMRAWECVPSVIRNNGTDTFRLEVNVNGRVQGVWLTNNANYVKYVSGPDAQPLRDDGLNGDRRSGDYIFTSAPLNYNTNATMADYLWWDTNSPAGMMFADLPRLVIVETNGTVNQFLIEPCVGILRSDIPLTEGIRLASNIVATPHLINVQTTNRNTQITMRYTSIWLNSVTLPIYAVLPDAFDFHFFFSVDHVEWAEMMTSYNFAAGIHYAVKVNYAGTGKLSSDTTSAFGSSGRLQGVMALDTADRGVYAYNATHELTHQWCSFTSPALGLSKDDSHYVYKCDVNSAVGGQHWIDQGNGIFFRGCDQSYAGPHAQPLDRYMMGLIWSSNVPPMHFTTNNVYCDDLITNATTVTISDIQAVHGVRTPTPATAQKDFSLCFIAESFARLLDPVELTFYERLAAQYTKPLPPGANDPDMGSNWASVTRYYGEGVTWNGDVLASIRPRITVAERTTNGVARISGMGYPGRNYRLLRTTNFVAWTTVTNQTASTNGAFSLVDGTPTPGSPRFYRIATP